MIEKKLVTTATINGEEAFKSIENISVKMVDEQEAVIMQTVANEIDKAFNGRFVDITLDRKKLERALLNAIPVSAHFSFDDNNQRCGGCYGVLKTEYSFCPMCGRKIKWN